MVLQTYYSQQSLIAEGNRRIKEKDVISFDLFDTLLIRRVHDPDLVKLPVARFISSLADKNGIVIGWQIVQKLRDSIEQKQRVETGEKFEEHFENIDQDFIDSMSFFEMADEELKKFIENLNVSADIKSLLYSFSKATIKAGEFVLKIGRKIIDFVFLLYREYPSATFGMVFGAIAGFLVASIPLLGAVLGPIFTPIAIAIGLLGGLREDLKDKALIRRVAEINANFAPLAA